MRGNKFIPGYEKNFIQALELSFNENADPSIAVQQKAYMKDQFEFIGIKTPVRRTICKPFLQKTHLPPKDQAVKIVQALWKKPEREFQYFAQELLLQYTREFEKKYIELIEWMIVHKSWWDTVDMIADKLAGAYFKIFPEQIPLIIKKWLKTDNMWLQRSCIIFQLKYKSKVDTHLLEKIILPLMHSKEFFINKAIGWILREYSKTNPDWVQQFAARNKLSNLSRREALRLMK